MENFNIVYIIALIIYFIYSALKKGKQVGEDNGPDSNDLPREQRKPASFEDLLREIRENQREQKRDLEASGQGNAEEIKRNKEPEPVIETYKPDRGTLHEEKPEKRRFQDFEGEISQKNKKFQKLDDVISIDEPIEGIRSELKSIPKNPAAKPNKYRAMLQDPKTVKDAVILSEILNRKY
jgi:hypothetical protein